MAGYQYIEVKPQELIIKFDQTVKPSTLVNSHFKLFVNGVTDPNPFKAINLSQDYISTSRELILRFVSALQSGKEYTFKAENLTTVFGNPILGLPIEYIFHAPAGLLTDPVTWPTPLNPIDVEDHSITSPPPITTTPIDSNDLDTATPGNSFKIVEVIPNLSESIQLGPLDNAGKISVKFSHKPAANFINPQDFKLQKKSVSAGFNKWETVNTVVAADSLEPKVNIYLPSVETPVTYSYIINPDSGHTFWQSGYSYRLIINSKVGY